MKGATTTIRAGRSIRYLVEPVTAGREPVGLWYGSGAYDLGLSGEVDHGQLEAVYSCFLDPRDPRFTDLASRGHAARLPGSPSPRELGTADERLAAALEQKPSMLPEDTARLHIDLDRAARHTATFYDVTLTTFAMCELNTDNEADATAWADQRLAVEDAVWAGNWQLLDFLADQAGYARVQEHGRGARYVDAHDWVVAAFFHAGHDNNPRVHVHNALLSQAEGSDGQWHTLDIRDLRQWLDA